MRFWYSRIRWGIGAVEVDQARRVGPWCEFRWLILGLLRWEQFGFVGEEEEEDWELSVFENVGRCGQSLLGGRVFLVPAACSVGG